MATRAPLRRLMLTSRVVGPCPYGCSYCFKDFDGPAMQALEDLHIESPALTDVDVLYPACDVDLLASTKWEQALIQSLSLGKHVSLSTKAPLSSKVLTRLKAIDSDFSSAGLTLKISISISTKHQASIEPHTPPYTSRLRALAGLAEAGMTTSLALRPVLSDVPLVEYVEILRDCRPYTQRVLFGDEWLDPANPRTAPSGESSMERVTWLPDTQWIKRRDKSKRMELALLAQGLGYTHYDSDLDLMRSVLSAA